MYSFCFCQVEDDISGEFEVWQGLANLYSGLSYWKDADTCLEKARALKPFSSATLHVEGNSHVLYNTYPRLPFETSAPQAGRFHNFLKYTEL